MILSRCRLVVIACISLSLATSLAEGDKFISNFMKKYHKAPEGTDPVSKKVGLGTATDAEIAEMLKGYEDMGKIDPPRGDKAGWEKRTKAVADALTLIAKKDPKGPADYKAAINCKACHTDHKPAK